MHEVHLFTTLRFKIRRQNSYISTTKHPLKKRKKKQWNIMSDVFLLDVILSWDLHINLAFNATFQWIYKKPNPTKMTIPQSLIIVDKRFT